ncbi:MAG: AAA family ATPase [Rhodococcus sp. (in: high G+C Gram-positive bacteria)]|uniref:AAA family ATPase n=1 Tax=Rhodococcus sp. TaxID=1831 RepID=UPI002AD9393D|nr:AAA family ATPase [Rhodococcus sp. (in: high G+C Gram-positive bacteria)]
MEPLDVAFAKYQQILPQLVESLTGRGTEADARLQVIDRLLIEVLNWDRSDIRCEKKSGDGYADYVLSIAGKSRMVVEAKRDGRDLGCRSKAAGQAYKLNGPVFKTPAASEGIRQGILYCAMNSSELACVTNGLEWIVYRGNRLGDGSETLEGMAYVFPSLTELEVKFGLFYDLLAKPSVNGLVYRPHFQEAEGQPIRTSIFSRALRRAGSARLKPSGELSKDLDRTMSEFFQRLGGEGDDEMVYECFVESPESRLADHRIVRIASDLLAQVQPIETTHAAALTAAISRGQELDRREFVLLVGTKGSGKSTFVDRFFKVVLPKDVAERCIVIRIDMKDNPGDSRSVVTWLNKRIVASAESAIFPDSPTFAELQGMFFDEYKRLSKGPYSTMYARDREEFHQEFGSRIDALRTNDPHTYLQGLIRHVRTQRRSLPVVVIDNADHFDIEFQQHVYQYARSLYEKSACLVIMPITDRTSWQLSKHGALQSFEVTSLFLPTPQIGDVIRKRIEFIDAKVEHEKLRPQSDYFVKHGISLSVKDLNGFAKTMQRIFLDMPNVSRTVGALANFDIRRTLDLVRKTMVSPHIEVDQLVATYISAGSLTIPRWRIDKAIIRQGYEVYPAEQHDFVQNIFDLHTNVTTSPLLGVRILTLLRDVPDKEHEGRSIHVDSVRAYLTGMGLPSRPVDLYLDFMLKTGLIQNYDPTVQSIDDCTLIEVTDSGLLHLRWATGGDEYLSAMTEVTPIINESVYERLQAYRHTDWRKRTAEFIEYLRIEDSFYCTIPVHPNYQGQDRLQQQLCEVEQRLSSRGSTPEDPPKRPDRNRR